VLEVVSQLERRLEATEAKAAEEGRALRMEIARLLALLAPPSLQEQEHVFDVEEELDGPLAAALQLIETLEAGDAGGPEKEGEEEDDERWAAVRAELLRAAKEEARGAQKYHYRQRFLRGDEKEDGDEEEEAPGSLSPHPPAAATGGQHHHGQRPRPSSLRRHPTTGGSSGKAKGSSSSSSNRGQSPSFLDWLARGKDGAATAADAKAAAKPNKQPRKKAAASPYCPVVLG
jgi:hypothetical protein